MVCGQELLLGIFDSIIVMPIYTYQIMFEDGEEGPILEVEQSIDEPPYKIHPLTGHKLVRLPSMPYINTYYSKKNEEKLKDPNALKALGFKRYQKDKLTGKYFSDEA